VHRLRPRLGLRERGGPLLRRRKLRQLDALAKGLRPGCLGVGGVLSLEALAQRRDLNGGLPGGLA
jgi:hypothetical protein